MFNSSATGAGNTPVWRRVSVWGEDFSLHVRAKRNDQMSYPIRQKWRKAQNFITFHTRMNELCITRMGGKIVSIQPLDVNG
jgi:ferredoxin--NADP+ reductase